MDTVLPSAVPDSAAPVAGDSGLSEQQLIQYIHSLRENQVVEGLFEDLKKEKHMSLTKLAHILKITDGLSNINIVESSVEPKTRALLEGIQQKVYDGIGLCPSIGGSFSELLGSLSLSATITKDLGSMEEFSREGKDNCSAECSFSVWIEKLKKDLELKASSASKELPEGCEWNWEDEFVEDLIRDESTMAQFSDLNHALLKLSLERRADVLENQQQICIYSECLRRLLEDESVVVEACERWTENREKYWMDSRYYEHHYYDIVRRPLQEWKVGAGDTWVAPMGETREQPILDAPAPVDRYKALSYMYS
uniref:Uncharacterized protein n=1 Tax=Oryza glumipatula TaxID=40148 RepID=A0A0E0BJI3_9ORYZ